MNLSFSQLERARKNPAKFGRAVSPAPTFFNNANFRVYFFAAMRLFHSGQTTKAVVQFFDDKCTARLNHQQHFQSRLNHYKTVLTNYCNNFSKQGCQFVEASKRISLALKHHTLKGRIERFDLSLPLGYRATTTQLNQSDWDNELRWPLVQKAISQEFGCPTGEVQVGVFCFENGQYEYRIYTDDEITAAEIEAESVLTTVEANIPEP
jgi:hypothetical protein